MDIVYVDDPKPYQNVMNDITERIGCVESVKTFVGLTDGEMIALNKGRVTPFNARKIMNAYRLYNALRSNT